MREKTELGLDPLHAESLQTLRTFRFQAHIRLREHEAGARMQQRESRSCSARDRRACLIVPKKTQLLLNPVHAKIFYTLHAFSLWAHINVTSTKLRPAHGEGRAGDVQQGAGGKV